MRETGSSLSCAASWVAASLLLGCHPAEALFPPEPGAEATVLGLGPPSAPRMLALDGASPAAPFSLASGDRLVAVVYDFSLAQMGLEPGVIPAVGVGGPGRPLPPGYRAYEATGDPRSWRPVAPSVVGEVLGATPLADVSPGECASLGGCERLQSVTPVALHCELPCAEPRRPQPPAPPAPPDPPRFLPCPAGWSAIEESSATHCVPPPRRTCRPGTMQLSSASECEPVGSACAADGWPARLPVDAVFVRVGSVGGDGTRAQPFGTLSEALAIVGEGGTVAIARGRVTEPVFVSVGVTLVGACAADTVLESVVITGRGVELSDLSVVTAGVGVSVRGAGAQVMLRSVEVTAVGLGVEVRDGARLQAERLAIRGGERGGLQVVFGATAEVDGLVVEDARSAGVLVLGRGSRVALEDLAVGRTDGEEFETLGYGMMVRDFAHADVSGAHIFDNRANHMSFWVSATASVARAHLSGSRGPATWGIDLDESARVRASQITAQGLTYGAAWVFRGSKLELEDLYATDCDRYGVFVKPGSTLTLTRARFAAMRGRVVTMEEGTATVRHVQVDGVEEDVERRADAFEVDRGRLVLERARIENVAGRALAATSFDGIKATVDAKDLDIRRIGLVRGSRGIDYLGSAELVLERARLQEIGGEGIRLRGIAGSRLEDVDIRDIGDSGLDLREGVVRVARLSVERSRRFGVSVQRAEVTTEDVSVNDVALAGDGNGDGGRGLFIAGQATVEGFRFGELSLSRFWVRNAAVSDVLIENYADFLAVDGELSDASIGIDVRQARYDLMPQLTNVIFRRNQTNVVLP